MAEYYRNFGKNYLKTIAVKEKGKIVVITAHWIAKLKK